MDNQKYKIDSIHNVHQRLHVSMQDWFQMLCFMRDLKLWKLKRATCMDTQNHPPEEKYVLWET